MITIARTKLLFFTHRF